MLIFSCKIASYVSGRYRVTVEGVVCYFSKGINIYSIHDIVRVWSTRQVVFLRDFPQHGTCSMVCWAGESLVWEN